MAWKHRQAKRKRRAAIARDRKKSRTTGSSAGKWWLTIVLRKTCCANPACRGILRVGGEMVFRKVPGQALCVACADRTGIRYRPSHRWEQNRIAQRKRRQRRRDTRIAQEVERPTAANPNARSIPGQACEVCGTTGEVTKYRSARGDDLRVVWVPRCLVCASENSEFNRGTAPVRANQEGR